tara:strand:+ start:180766 stop:181107 length:342 start_codon:yes stop_codon:yes gene_type:complete
MLITFKSKAAADIVMYEEHAKRMLDLLHKDVKLGVITAAETDHAIKVLEGEVAENKTHFTDAVQRDIAAHHNESGDDHDHEQVEVVQFSSRIYPLLEMLRAAREENCDVLWGV